jgi:hypothetical protein
MSASLVHRAMHAQSATRSFFDGERSAMRLSEQFRANVHQATTAEVESPARGNGLFLRIHLPDEQIVEFRQMSDSVLRVMSRHDAVISRDEFAFPSPLELAVREEQSPQRLVLTVSAGSLAKATPTVEEQPPSAYAMPLNVEVEACLDRDFQSAIPATPAKERQ